MIYPRMSLKWQDNTIRMDWNMIWHAAIGKLINSMVVEFIIFP